MDYIHSFHGIIELLKTIDNKEIKKISRLLFCGSGPRLREIIKLSQNMGIKCFEVDKKMLNSISINNRGAILELFESPSTSNGLSLNFFLQNIVSKKSEDDNSLIIALDHITDPSNLGAILRSADAFKVDLAISPRDRASPLNSSAMDTSAGASAYVPFSTVTNLAEALKRLSEFSFSLVATDKEGENLDTFKFDKKAVLVFGAEGRGLSELIKNICHYRLTIPTKGHIDSLNVSAAASVFMYEYRRQHKYS